MVFKNKDYISQLPLQLGAALYLSFSHWDSRGKWHIQLPGHAPEGREHADKEKLKHGGERRWEKSGVPEDCADEKYPANLHQKMRVKKGSVLCQLWQCAGV